MRKISTNLLKANTLIFNKSLMTIKTNLICNKFIGKQLTTYNSIFSINKYHFSSGKPPQKNQNQQSENKDNQRQKQDKQQFMENAQMTGENEKDKNSSPFVPSSFGNYFIGISCIALLLAYALMQVQFMRAANAKKTPAQGTKKVIAKGKAHIGGDWQLIGVNGEKISQKNFQGKYYLIYFGFCNCPDICPNSLNKLAKALQKVRKSGQSKFYNIQTVFVSVDPDRDTPQKIQKFAKYFDKSIIGVTGLNNQDPALKDCMKKFKIYASKIEFQDQDSVIKGRKSYTIDHTILTYLMNPQNQYLAHIGANLGQHDIAKLIMEKIKQDQRNSMQKLKV